VEASFDQITTAGLQVGVSPKTPFDSLTSHVTVREPGFAYVYISNENPTQVDVYFDDFKIEHRQGHVIQYNEYYPFGMQNQNSWTRENAKGNDFLYNAGNEKNSLTGLYDMFYRNYDPSIARMVQVDPMADQYSSLTTYGYANNDPVYFNDPSGAITDDQWWAAPRAAWGNRGDPLHWRREQEAFAKSQEANWGSEAGERFFGNQSGFSFNSLSSFVRAAMHSEYGGSWSSSGAGYLYGTKSEAVTAGRSYVAANQIESGLDYTYGLSKRNYWRAVRQYNRLIAPPPFRQWMSSRWNGERTQRHGPFGFQDNGILTQEQLKDYFGESYMEVFHNPLMSKISSGTFSTQDVINYVQDFNYSDIRSKTGPYGLFPVEGGRFHVTDPSGISVLDKDLFHWKGTGIHFGYLGKVSSGELSGQGLIRFTTSSGYMVQFSLRFEGRIIN
jgi:RHS repeat-associated protein